MLLTQFQTLDLDLVSRRLLQDLAQLFEKVHCLLGAVEYRERLTGFIEEAGANLRLDNRVLKWAQWRKPVLRKGRLDLPHRLPPARGLSLRAEPERGSRQ